MWTWLGIMTEQSISKPENCSLSRASSATTIFFILE